MQPDDAVVITQKLGRVFSEDPNVHCTGNPSGNSTRWVFDVEQEIYRTQRFMFELRSWTGGRVHAPIISFSISPLSASFWRAAPYFACPELPVLVIDTDPPGLGYPRQSPAMLSPIQYRIAIDLVHSTSR